MHLARTGAHSGIENRTLFNIRDQRGDADDNARLDDARTCDNINQLADQRLCQNIIRDHAVLQRMHNGNIFRRAAFHFIGFLSDGDYALRALVERDYGRFIQHNAPAALCDNDIRRTEVNSDIHLFASFLCLA